MLGCIFSSLSALMLIGIWCFRRVRTEADYFLAGRRLPVWGVAVSLAATEITVMTVMTLPMWAYSRDLRSYQYLFGAVIGRIVVAFLFLPFFLSDEDPSLFAFFARRFGPASRRLGAVLYCISSITSSSVRFMLACVSLHILTGWDVVWILPVLGVCSTAYVALGGIYALVWGGVLQIGLVLGAGAALLSFINAKLMGDVGEILHVAREAGRLAVWGAATQEGAMMIVTGSFVAAVLGVGLNVEIIQRLKSVRGDRGGRWALLASIPLVLIIETVFLAVGTGLFVYYEQHPEFALPQGDRSILAHFAIQTMPAGLQALLASAVVLSSIDASLLGMGTSAVHDIFPMFGWRDPARRRGLLGIRSVIVVFGCLLTALAGLLLGTGSWIPIAFKTGGVLMSPVLGVLLAGFFTRWRAPRLSGSVMGGMALLDFGLLLLFEDMGLAWGWEALLLLGAGGAFALLWLGLGRSKPSTGTGLR